MGFDQEKKKKEKKKKKSKGKSKDKEVAEQARPKVPDLLEACLLFSFFYVLVIFPLFLFNFLFSF